MVRPYPKPARENKDIVLKQLEDICRRLAFWRDGGICIEQEIDGGRCGGAIQWGHFIPRQQSKYLKYSLSNTFCQCSNHNGLHHHGAQTMGAWYSAKFGEQAHVLIDKMARENVGAKILVSDYRERLEYYIRLYENRPALHDLGTLIQLGYYGDVPQMVNCAVAQKQIWPHGVKNDCRLFHNRVDNLPCGLHALRVGDQAAYSQTTPRPADARIRRKDFDLPVARIYREK